MSKIEILPKMTMGKSGLVIFIPRVTCWLILAGALSGFMLAMCQQAMW